MSKFLVALDDGHGPHTAGKRTPYIAALGRQIRENEFNQPVVNLIEKELKRCGIGTIQLAPNDLDVPLVTRTNKANAAKVDLLLSIHFNAMGNTFGYSSARGFSVHIQPELKANTNSSSYKLAKLLSEEISKGTKQVNRGIVGQNLHMTRATNMPAALLEFGFMDDEEEALLMINKAFQLECAVEVAKAVCRYLGVTYVPAKTTSATKPANTKLETNTDQYYRVRVSWNNVHSQIGAFHDLGSAKAKANSRRTDNYKVFDPAGNIVYTPPKLVNYTIPNQTLSLNSRGAQVELLQEALNAAKFKLKGKVDGIFGADTLQALKRFQMVYLPKEVDGIAGPNTRGMLNRVLN